MANQKQISYFKDLLRKLDLNPEEYDLFEDIPHSVISPAIDQLKRRQPITAGVWNSIVLKFKVEEGKEGEKYQFIWELNQIQSLFIRSFVKKMLEKIPEYFYTVPASSTGKYHPDYAAGQGGLLRHTIAAVKIAVSLLENPILQKFNQDEKDIIVATLILHDTVKYGLVKQEYTVTEHPMLVEKLYGPSMIEDASEEQKGFVELIFRAIRSHMGPWNTDRFSGKEIMPKPETALERFVHMCDYLASRKFIEIKF